MSAIERLWPTYRARVTHLYVRGAGVGDGALCGAPLHADYAKFAVLENDPECARCNALHQTEDGDR